MLIVYHKCNVGDKSGEIKGDHSLQIFAIWGSMLSC